MMLFFKVWIIFEGYGIGIFFVNKFLFLIMFINFCDVEKIFIICNIFNELVLKLWWLLYKKFRSLFFWFVLFWLLKYWIKLIKVDFWVSKLMVLFIFIIDILGIKWFKLGWFKIKFGIFFNILI